MTGVTTQSPTGGWNAVSALADMAPTDALRLDNLIPSAEDVRSRNGYSEHTTPALSTAQSIVSYNGATPKLLLGANADIHDITAAGAGVPIGGPGGALAFTENGSGEINFGNVLNQTTNDFSVEARIVLATTPTKRTRILGKDSSITSAGTAGWTLYIDTAKKLSFSMSDGTNQVIGATTAAITLDVRTHVAATIENGVSLRFWIDGTEDAVSPVDISSVTGSITNTDDLLTVSNSLGEAPEITIDELRLWDDVRTGTEIDDNKDTTVSASATNLIGYWKMDDGSGSTVTDSHASSNDGTITGTTTWTNSLLTGVFTSNKWYTSGYKARIIFCNSADTPVVYNGSDGVITAASITGPTVTDLAGSVTFKGRVIYWEKPAGTNPQSFWYASAGAYQGALTEYTLDQFTAGGYVVECLNWTHDGGTGLDDHFVILMSTGQVLIYAGSDPGDATDWNLVGIYAIGEPIGTKPSTLVGGDAIILTKDGYLVLSAAIQEGRYSENSAFSYKISNAARQATQTWGGVFGWEATLFTNASLFVVNVPISATESVQHVRNTTTGAWCKFTGFNAVAFESHNGSLYFVGTDNKVYKYAGTSDNGSFIPMTSVQAYDYLGAPGIKKQVTAIEVISNYAFPKYLTSSFWSDYNEKTLPAIVDPPEPNPSDWDVGEWDSAEWDASAQGTNTARRNASGYGYALAHTLQLRSRAQQFIWYANHIYVKPGGTV